MRNIVFCTLLFLLMPLFSWGKENKTYTFQVSDTGRTLGLIDQAAAFEFIDPDSCIALLRPILELSKHNGFNRGVGAALTHIGLAHMAIGETDSALLYYHLAMPYVQQSSYDRSLVALLYTGIGFPYLRKSDYRLAGSFFYRALAVITENNLQESAIAARLYMDIGDLWWVLRRYADTKNYFLKSEKIAQELNDTAALIAIYGNLGNLYYSLNDLGTSDVYMRHALALAEQKHVVRAQQQILANMGATLRQTGRPKEAIPYFEKAVALADGRHAHQHNLQSYYNLGFAYYDAGDYEKAKVYVQKAIRLSEALDMDKEHIGEAMLVMAGIFEKEHDYEAANQWLNRHIALVEDMLEKQADSSINRLEDNYRVAQKDKQIAQKQLLLSKKELEIKNKNSWIIGFSAGLLLLGMLLFIVVRLNNHKRHLNEMEIRNLTQEKQLLYLKAIMEGEEKERARLARDLHDGIGGMLASAKMTLGAIKDADRTASLESVMRLLSDTADEVRQTAHNLMPDILTKNSLKDALLLYSADISAGGRPEIDVQFHGRLEEMNKSVELIFYRIAQELIQNIVKHSRATSAVIQIIQDDGRLNLIVEDNGIGFEQSEINKGFGLQNLQFRVQSLQGYISITSAIGKGTSVYIEFDLEKLKNV
ncbi:tetratricopeptide repeat-containing sensor histidine kinase [Taibaiella soli]|uniref:histidine kinase n=1 Tax=Taibaiella soli TaxID=1649169 RepID=A0A2W2ABJ2_9BACT|nr:sensor histidine kinase [Taibaiella soli]PZF72681.1 hypothetical protein DN068_12515 [Taibaiella soli]